jgi:hypothetical protein
MNTREKLTFFYEPYHFLKAQSYLTDFGFMKNSHRYHHTTLVTAQRSEAVEYYSTNRIGDEGSYLKRDLE